MHGKTDWGGSKHLRNTEILTESTVSQRTSSVIFSKDSIRCSSVKKSNVSCWDWMRHHRFSQEEFFSCRCSTKFPVDQKTMKKNTCQMPISLLYMQEDFEQDNGHLLVLVLRKSGTLSVKIVHKENGTIWRKGCCWNSHKADIPFSVLQVLCPEVDSKAKVMENCRYTIQPIWKRLRLFFAYLFLQISSVFTEQSQKCVKSTKPFTIERGNPLWEGNQVPHSC